MEKSHTVSQNQICFTIPIINVKPEKNHVHAHRQLLEPKQVNLVYVPTCSKRQTEGEESGKRQSDSESSANLVCTDTLKNEIMKHTPDLTPHMTVN